MSATIRASHIAIGTELTSGQTLNTNSRMISEHLREAGVKNQFHIVVPDTQDLILKSFDYVAPESDWIFVYGGLGPTTDDFTRNMVSEWTGKELKLDQASWQNIQDILNSRGYPIRDFQKQQAFFPEGSRIMTNSKGTAHGFHVSAKGKEIFVVPGPPKEVQSVFENYLKNWIPENIQTNDTQITEIWNTLGLGESEVAYQVEDLIKDYDVVVGYRVHLPYVEVKITYLKSQSSTIRPLVDEIGKTLQPILVYKDHYPYPSFLRSLLADTTELAIIDNATNGGLMNDLMSWIPSWSTKKIAYFTYSDSTAKHYSNILKILRSENMDPVKIHFKTDRHNIQLEIPISTLSRMPVERHPLYIKEFVYRDLFAKVGPVF